MLIDWHLNSNKIIQNGIPPVGAHDITERAPSQARGPGRLKIRSHSQCGLWRGLGWLSELGSHHAHPHDMNSGLGSILHLVFIQKKEKKMTLYQCAGLVDGTRFISS
jgi:hypothetical protein